MDDYKVDMSEQAELDICVIPNPLKRNIFKKIGLLTGGLIGDIKKLSNFAYQYRLRVNDYRVLFNIEAENTIVIHRILHRSKSYKA